MRVTPPVSDQFRTPDYLSLRFRQLGGETAVFNESAATTHLLEALAGQLLIRLASGSCRRAELVSLVESETGAADSGGCGEYVNACLAQFIELGLIERERGAA